MSGLALLVGLLWVGFTLGPFLWSWEEGDHLHNLMIAVMSGILLVPGLILWGAGWSLWREMSEVALGKVLGVLTVSVVGCLGSLLESVPVWLTLYLAVVLGVPAYLVLMRSVYGAFTGVWRECGSFVGRGMLGLLAFLIWLGLADLGVGWGGFGRFSELFAFLGPLLLALGFYRMGCRFFVGRVA